VLVYQRGHLGYRSPSQVMQDKSSCRPPSSQCRLCRVPTSLEQEIHRLRETGPCGREWSRGYPFRCVEASSMIRVILVDKGHQGTSIGEGHTRPRCCFSISPWVKR